MAILLIQTTVDSYRQQVIEALCRRFGGSFRVFAGDEYFDPSVRTRIEVGATLVRVRNVFFANRRILFQRRVLRPAVSAEAVILELNPRIASVWLILITRRLIGKRSAVWGHVWARGGRRRTSDLVRLAMWRLAGVVVLYTRAQAEELLRWRRDVRVIVASNALYRREEIFAGRRAPAGFICVGRLVESKRPMALLLAFAKARESLGPDATLTFIGDGPQLGVLRDAAADLGLGGAVEFRGHVSDVGVLRSLYDQALASVSPGYVGLSLVQSLSFGVPMIIARDAPHAPEIAAAEPGRNCLFFEGEASLSDAMISLARERDRWIRARAGIAAACASEYSVEAMADGLSEAVAAVINKGRS